MAFSKIFFFALSLNGTQLCLLKRGLELIFLRSIPHFVHWWWGVFPKKFSCSMLVPTTTQGMSIELSLNLCLSIQFRALEFASGSAEPSFWIHFWGNQSLISLLLRCVFGLFSLVGWGQVQHACPHHHTRALEFPPTSPDYSEQVL